MPTRLVSLAFLIALLGLPLGALSCSGDSKSPTVASDPRDPQCQGAPEQVQLIGPTGVVWLQDEDGSSGGLSHFLGEPVSYSVSPIWPPATTTEAGCNFDFAIELASNAEGLVDADLDPAKPTFRLTPHATGTIGLKLVLTVEGLEMFRSDWISLWTEKPLVLGGFEILDVSDELNPLPLYRELQGQASDPSVSLKRNDDRLIRIVLLDESGEPVPERMLYGEYSIEVEPSGTTLEVTEIDRERGEYRWTTTDQSESALGIQIKRGEIVLLDTEVPVFVDAPHWAHLSPTMDGPNALVFNALVHGDDLIVFGNYSEVGDVVASGIARWDGQEWHAMEGGQNPVLGLGAASDGTRLVVGDSFNGYSEWNGSEWIAVYPRFSEGYSTALAISEGEIYAGKTLSVWAGTKWDPVFDPEGFEGATWAASHNGQLMVAAEFDRIGVPSEWFSVASLTVGSPTVWQEWLHIDRENNRLRDIGVHFMASFPAGLLVSYSRSEDDVLSHGVELLRDRATVWVSEGSLINGAASVGERVFLSDRQRVYEYTDGARKVIGTASGRVNGLVEYGGRLYAYGSFRSIEGVAVENLAVWVP